MSRAFSDRNNRCTASMAGESITWQNNLNMASTAEIQKVRVWYKISLKKQEKDKTSLECLVQIKDFGLLGKFPEMY